MSQGSQNNNAQSHDQRILKEQANLLYSGLPFSAIGTLVVSFLMVFILRDKVESQLLAYAWLVFMFVMMATRLWDWRQYLASLPNDKDASRWCRRFLIGSTTAGIGWGASAWLMFPPNHPEYQVLLMLGIVGIVSGGMAVLSYMSQTILYFLTAVFGLLALKLLVVGTALSLIILGLLMVFSAFTISSARRIYNNTQQNIRLRIEAVDREESVYQMQQRHEFQLRQTSLAE